MHFAVKPTLSDCENLQRFFDNWKVGPSDLIVTNEFLIRPQLGGRSSPCDCLYQEQYGRGEPSDEMVDAMLRAVEGKEYKRIIAIGGGTVIDIAKLFVFGGGLDCAAIFAGGAALPRRRELIILPTTCGTGSEVTGISIVEFKQKQSKLGLAIPALYADEAVLIPSLLDTMPYEVFAASSIDALIHAVESYVSPKANPFTRALGRSAIEMILKGYRALVRDGGGLPADMRDFLLASAMAGIAFGNAGCAAVHALSYPIGGEYHIPHGKANYMVFDAVFTIYREMGAALSPLESVLADALDCAVHHVWPQLAGLLEQVLPLPALADLGVNEQKCGEMADSVVLNQQRLLANTPVPLTRDDIKRIYLHSLLPRKEPAQP